MSLVQVGLEVPCEVTATVSGSAVIHLLLTRHEKPLREFHIELKNEEMIGTFLSVAKSRQQKKQQEKKEVR